MIIISVTRRMILGIILFSLNAGIIGYLVGHGAYLAAGNGVPIDQVKYCHVLTDTEVPSWARPFLGPDINGTYRIYICRVS